MRFAKNFVDFAKNSSVHGIKYTVDSTTSMLERLFWILVILLSISCSGYLTVLFWSRYTNNPTRTTIETNSAPISTVPFPGITICNLNKVLESKVDSFLETLDADQDELLITKNMISKIINFESFIPIKNSSQSEYINLTESAIAQEVLEKNGYSDIKRILTNISESCEEMIIKCAWNKKPVQCRDIFEETYTIRGRCCSFNYIQKGSLKQTLYSLHYGFSTGLKVTLIPAFNSRKMAGVTVTVHKPKDFPNEHHNIMRTLTLGRVNYMQIQGLKRRCSDDVKDLHISHRQCIYSNEKELDYFNAYTYSNCLSLCEAVMVIDRCQCVPYYYDFAYENPVCKPENSTCSENISNVCDCPSQCEDEFYEVILTTAQFTNESRKWTFGPFTDFNDTENSILLNVFFINNRQTIWLRDTITSGIYLISSFGGIYSLFLGCSIITLFEIVYFFFGRCLMQNICETKTNGINEVMTKKFVFESVGLSKKIDQSQYYYPHPIVPYVN